MLAQSQKVEKPVSPPQPDLKRDNLFFENLEYGARTEGFASPPSHPHFIIKSTLQSTGLAWNGCFSFHWLRALLETVKPAAHSHPLTTEAKIFFPVTATRDRQIRIQEVRVPPFDVFWKAGGFFFAPSFNFFYRKTPALRRGSWCGE